MIDKIVKNLKNLSNKIISMLTMHHLQMIMLQRFLMVLEEVSENIKERLMESLLIIFLKKGQ